MKVFVTASSPDERSDIRDHSNPAYRFTHSGYQQLVEQKKARLKAGLFVHWRLS
jgi:hypothetical protein